MNASAYPNLHRWLADERMFRRGVSIADEHLAIVAQEHVSEDWCAEHSPYPQINVEAIFGEAERALKLFGARVGNTMHTENLARLTAMLGARGVKTGLLASDADYWECARAMWPKHVTGEHESAAHGLHDLEFLLNSMSKRQRRAADKAAIPERFKATPSNGVAE